MKLFAVKDTCSGEFFQPNIYSNEAVAVRAFDNLCSKSDISTDLQLFYLGDYNVETGEIFSNVKFIKGANN